MSIANICFFVASSVSLYHQPHPSSTGHNQEEVRAKQRFPSSSQVEKSCNLKNHPNRLQVMFTLFVLMGIPWMTEIIMLYAAESFSAAVTDVFNILTGLVVFMLLVCKPNIVRLLCKRYPRFDRLVATISNQPFFKFITRNNSKCSEKPVKSTVKTSVNTSVNTEPRINDAARY